MAKFRFRLEKLLEYRRLQEKWAKDTYLEARARRNEGEGELEGVRTRRAKILSNRPANLQALRDFEAFLIRLDDDEQGAIAMLGVLEDEEKTARDEWIAAKSEAEAIQKLREQAYADWQREELKREQAELDEWAVLRRSA